MLRISKLTDYAIIIMGYMAKTPEQSFTAGDLAGCSGVAVPTVSKVLKLLTRSSLLKSTRGSKGGYRLARPPEQTTVASIIFALEGPIALTECGIADDHCLQASSCHIRGNWAFINRAIRTALESVTLAEMAAPAVKPPEAIPISLNRIIHQPSNRAE